MSHKVDAYTIYDIAKWQVELEEKTAKQDGNTGGIQLPTLQRGFVWQPHQMEALWDSILRGYPVGSLLMSKDINNTKYLLDGQQRCTTIALGFQNPLKPISSNVLNIKKENIPSVWIDLKPLRDNQNGLRFAVRVLTRSHPWGYRLNNHTKRMSMADQRNALDYFRKKSGNDSLGFSQIGISLRSPWDAHFPVPLALVLNTDRTELKQKLAQSLQNIETKYGACDYTLIKENWLDVLYQGIASAKTLLLPEMLVDRESLEEDDVNTDSESEEDAVLFLRLNKTGTTISGQELIYSLIKASLPEAKELVEDIGMNFLSPTVVINLFVRFIKMKRKDFKSLERTISLQDFRKLLAEDGFKEDLKTFILSKEAKILMNNAVAVIKSHPSDLPPIFHKEVLFKNTDLLLVLLVYISQKKLLTAADKTNIRQSFLHSTLYCKSNNRRKIIPKFYNLINEKDWGDWGGSWKFIVFKNPTLIPPLLGIQEYLSISNTIKEQSLIKENRHISMDDFLGKVFKNEINFLETLTKHKSIEYNLDDEVDTEKAIQDAIKYWNNITQPVFWKRDFLIISQREYFNDQFGEYMAFEGIEDTNKPWDWDHIYPNSWVYSKRYISVLVKWLVNTNGNYRALSFNENRSQSNNESPEFRFRNKPKIQSNSFINENDLTHWLELTNNDYRLKEENPKVNDFVNAVLTRIDNIYRDTYEVIFEKS
jgi:hypothetical protein